MIKLSSVATRLDQAGLFLLGTLVFVGVFARGGANITYSLLFLWGIALWILSILNRRSPQANWPPLPPTRWAIGLAAFALTWLMSALTGGNPVAGLKALISLLYLLALPLLVWPIFNRWPDWPARFRLLWGMGLIVAAVLTFREGGYQLTCLRAKAYLGIIELGSVLGQLIPVVVASLLLALSKGRRRETLFFVLALAAACLALTQNCSRQTLLAAPALSLLIFWAYRLHFSNKLRYWLLVLAVPLVTFLSLSAGGDQRFLSTLAFKSNPETASVVLNEGDDNRVTLWKHGWDTFLAHPVLGQGPGSGFRLEVQPGEEEKFISHTHQIFINVLAETGLLGFFGFLALHLAPLSLLWPHRRSRDPETFFWVWAAIAVNLQLALNGLTDQVFSLKPMMYIHWTVMAAALWQTQQPQKEEPE